MGLLKRYAAFTSGIPKKTLLNSQLIKKNNLHKQFFSHKLLTYEKLKYKEVSWQDSNLRPSAYVNLVMGTITTIFRCSYTLSYMRLICVFRNFTGVEGVHLSP